MIDIQNAECFRHGPLTDFEIAANLCLQCADEDDREPGKSEGLIGSDGGPARVVAGTSEEAPAARFRPFVSLATYLVFCGLCAVAAVADPGSSALITLPKSTEGLSSVEYGTVEPPLGQMFLPKWDSVITRISSDLEANQPNYCVRFLALDVTIAKSCSSGKSEFKWDAVERLSKDDQRDLALARQYARLLIAARDAGRHGE